MSTSPPFPPSARNIGTDFKKQTIPTRARFTSVFYWPTGPKRTGEFVDRYSGRTKLLACNVCALACTSADGYIVIGTGAPGGRKNNGSVRLPETCCRRFIVSRIVVVERATRNVRHVISARRDARARARQPSEHLYSPPGYYTIFRTRTPHRASSHQNDHRRNSLLLAAERQTFRDWIIDRRLVATTAIVVINDGYNTEYRNVVHAADRRVLILKMIYY